MSPYYLETGSEKKIFEVAFNNRLPLMFVGPSGCGKTRFVEFMAHSLGRPLVTVVCNDETSTTDLLGRYLIKGGETVWQDGPVLSAIKSGAILYLDEVVEARDALHARGALQDGCRFVANHFSHNGGWLHARLEEFFAPHGIEVGHDGMVVEI